MFRRWLVRPLAVGVGVVALQLLSASTAFAHTVTIVAAAGCVDGAPVISYTAESPDKTIFGSNTQVDVLFDGVVVDSRPFVLPTNGFSGVQPAPHTGNVTVTANVVGLWVDGDFPRNASTVVNVPANCVEITGTGRFTGGPNGVDIAGVKVTTGLQIHCHPKDPSVNFEINWAGGNNFHLGDVTTVACYDTIVTPQPPKAPVDTIVAVGYGTYNNAAGYTIEFTLVDSGEPDNKRSDQMRILIYTTGNPADVKLNVPLQFITAGNIQAHYDQPHGGNGNK